MEVLYWIIVKSYGLLINVASLFSPKARLWVEGRRTLYKSLDAQLVNKDEKRIWFHCSSLGEFEQGRPVLERLRNEYINHKIVLTFFSPSGYELKKNTGVADYIFYLPLDGPRNSRYFLEKVNPVMAILVKYEFWHFYIKYLKKSKIPCFVISAVFRPGQIYFKKYGKFFFRILQRMTHLFVQNQSSLELLYKHTVNNVTVSGDTRFDRVYIISEKSQKPQSLELFAGSSRVFIAGSTWPYDDKLITALINGWKSEWKYIIAPHEISQKGINSLRQQIKKKTVLYSELNSGYSNDADVLIIDSVGLLSSAYSCGKIAYVGGGFGAGIHNTLEPAAFGLPVLFGPNYHQFREAEAMVSAGTGFAIHSSDDLFKIVPELANKNSTLAAISEKQHKFIQSNRGATNVIINYLRLNYPA